MDTSVIAFNVPNFVSIMLMVALGMFLFGLVGRVIHSQG